MASWKRLVRFVPKGNSSSILVGEPVNFEQDVGLASYNGEKIEVNVFSGKSVLEPGQPTGETAEVERVLSPVSMEEVGTIRCIGLNYLKHAKEANMPVPPVPVLFTKPDTALCDPYPANVIIQKHTIPSESADYETELGIVIGKTCKNVSEEEAMDYVLGYTATNDISARKEQLEQSQWCYGKSFDTSCPTGPVILSTRAVPDYTKLHMRGLKNGQVMQETGLDDLIFGIPKIVSFLSQGTTMRPGTLILTGTPHGIGIMMKPKQILLDGDEFRVEVSGGVGTLINKIEYEK